VKHAGPLALFAALAVAWTWPLVLHLGNAVPGDPGDNYSFLWNLWWMRHVLATPGLPYFHTTYLFYPFGTTIADHPHCALPAFIAATVLKPFSIATAYNLLLLAFLVANMAAMYALAWTLAAFADDGARRRAATLAAILFGLSPYVAVHLLGHFDLVAAWLLPAFALALHHAVHRRSNLAAFGGGLVLVAAAYTVYYYLVYLCLFAVVYLIAWALRVSIGCAGSPDPRRGALRYVCLAGAALFALLGIAIAATGGGSFSVVGIEVSSRTPQNALTAAWLCALIWLLLTWRPRLSWTAVSRDATRRALVVLAIVIATFIAGAAPLFREAALLVARGEYVSPRYGWRSAPRGIDAVAPFVGHPLHPLTRGVSARAYTAISADVIEAIAWVGVLPLLLLLATRRAWRGSSDGRIWLAVAAVFLVWSLGPFFIVAGFDTGLKLPEILARFVPFVANARMPGRAMVAVYMAIAVLIALGIGQQAVAPAWLRRPAVQWLAIAVIAFEYWTAPIHLTALDRPPVYQALAAAPAGAVCEVPFGIGDGLSVGYGSQDRRILFYATQHEHPLVGGYIGRMPPRAKERIEAMAVAGPLLRGGSLEAGELAGAAPCRYLVVNRAASSTEMLAYVKSLPSERIASDESRDLYRLKW
jgi:hypothetical protein